MSSLFHNLNLKLKNLFKNYFFHCRKMNSDFPILPFEDFGLDEPTVVNIFLYLDVLSLQRSARVNKAWRDFVVHKLMAAKGNMIVSSQCGQSPRHKFNPFLFNL